MDSEDSGTGEEGVQVRAQDPPHNPFRAWYLAETGTLSTATRGNRSTNTRKGGDNGP